MKKIVVLDKAYFNEGLLKYNAQNVQYAVNFRLICKIVKGIC